MSGVRKTAASERFKEFSGRVRRWEKKWVKTEVATAPAQFKWVAVGPDTRTEEERLAKRRKYTPLKVGPITDLESFLPPSGAGWGGEKVAAVVAEPDAPRRSLRARAERTYVDGEDDDFDERSMSEDEPAPPRQVPAALPAAAPPVAAPVAVPVALPAAAPAVAPAAAPPAGPVAPPPQPAGPV